MNDTYIVYAIQHNKTKKIYIGSTKRLVTERIKDHIRNLRNDTHTCENLQNDFNEYGEDFTFFVLEEGENQNVQHPYRKTNSYIMQKALSEYIWMDKYDSINPEYGYNSQDTTAVNFIKTKRELDDIAVNIEEGIPEGLNGMKQEGSD